MAYPATSLYPQTSGLYPGDGVEVVPTVVTGAITDIGLTSATFAGTVNPNGLTTHYYWEFDYGDQSATYNAGTGSSPVAVSKTVPLPSGTYMRVRLVAFNGAGFGYGEWSEEFYTQTAPIAEFLPDLITDAGRGQ